MCFTQRLSPALSLQEAGPEVLKPRQWQVGRLPGELGEGGLATLQPGKRERTEPTLVALRGQVMPITRARAEVL